MSTSFVLVLAVCTLVFAEEYLPVQDPYILLGVGEGIWLVLCMDPCVYIFSATFFGFSIARFDNARTD